MKNENSIDNNNDNTNGNDNYKKNNHDTENDNILIHEYNDLKMCFLIN